MTPSTSFALALAFACTSALVAPSPARAEPAPAPAPVLIPAPAPLLVPAFRPYSARMKTAGIVLTIVASSMMATGLTLFAIDPPGHWRDSDGLLGFLIAVPMMGTSTILASIGVPLWVSGAKAVPAYPAAALVPSVSIGPTSGALRWSF